MRARRTAAPGWARRLAGLAGGLLLAAAPALADTVVADTDALSQALRLGRPAARLQPLAAVQGCSLAGCRVQLGGLFVDTDQGGLRRAGGRPLPLVVDGPVAATDLPELNWTPLRAYAVRRGSRPWGQCLEFAHAGLGSSGRAQRWRSLVLVAAGGHGAHRVIGYQAACAALAVGARPGEVVLPTVQPVVAGAPALQIVWHHCTAGGCERSVDARSVDGRADSETGELTLRP